MSLAANMRHCGQNHSPRTTRYLKLAFLTTPPPMGLDAPRLRHALSSTVLIASTCSSRARGSPRATVHMRGRPSAQ
eukprot:scaffold1052_cov339-Pavlova_lutheri.AAC.28